MRKILTAAAMLVCLGGTALADPAPCHLRRVASLDLTVEPDGTIAFDTTVNGQRRPFALDLSATFSLVGDDAATELGLPVPDLQADAGAGAKRIDHVATIAELGFGGLRGKNISMVIAARKSLPAGMTGLIGTDLLSTYDVELDLAHGKLNLFAQDHCKGQVVYWSDSAATLPFTLETLGGIRVTMMLDHVAMDVRLQSMRQVTYMTYAAANRMFGLKRDSKAMTLLPPSDDHPLYQYPFKTLTAGGLAVANPQIVISDRGDGERMCDGKDHYERGDSRDHGDTYRCFGGADLSLGTKQLQTLRLMIAFSEKTLYLTPADAH